MTKTLCIALLAIAQLFVNALLITSYYNWFLIDAFNAGELDLLAGIALFILIRIYREDHKPENNNIYDRLGYYIAGPLFFVVCGYLITFFI